MFAAEKGQLVIINGLRAVAAFITCIFHFTWHSDDSGFLFDEGSWVRTLGYTGVQGVYIFFVISGFVIPLSLHHGKYTLSNFFRYIAKRLMRLHPPYIASILALGAFAVYYAIAGYLGGGELVWPAIDWSKAAHHLLFTAPFAGETWYQDVYWTLNIEFQYYLLMGLIFPLLMKGEKLITHAVLLAFLISSTWFGHDLKFVVFFHAPVFIAGITLFMRYAGRISNSELLVWQVLAIYFARYEVAPETAVAMGLTTLAILFLSVRNVVTDWMGDISYSVYLTHGFTGGQFLWYTAKYANTFWSQVGLVLAALAVTYTFSHFFARWVEGPSIRWSKKMKFRLSDSQTVRRSDR